MTIIRENLLQREGYTPYCGNDHGTCCCPRTIFNGEQFVCPRCKWETMFPASFINEYKTRWNIT